MTNYKLRSSSSSPHSGNPLLAPLLAILCALAFAGCEKAEEQPSSPEAPPKPKVMAESFSSEVKRAVFTYSSKPIIQFQNGQGTRIERHVIHT